MAELKLGQDFTEEETLGEPMPVITGESGETAETVEEKETPPASPAEEEPSEEGETPQADDAELLSDTEREEKAREIQGIEAEKARLLAEVQELRGERRKLKQAEADKLQTEIDELKDLDPQDVSAIERIVRSKGFLTKDEVESRLYNQRKEAAIDKFLEKYPEYKKENDPNDIRWGALEREMEDFRAPFNPDKVYDLLVRAHKEVGGTPTSDTGTPAQRQRLSVASMGGGGQRSFSQKSATVPDWMIESWRQGGWSEEEIKENIKNYQE